MPISSGAGGRQLRQPAASRSAFRRPPSAARSTPNLLEQLQPTSGRMIDAPPRVEARRQLGSQTLYGSRPPWATDDDAPSPQQQQQSTQPPFYPAGGDLLHGEAARMRRLKAARQLYRSPQSRHQHTGSVDDLLRDCTISDHSHSHSPSPVRRAPSSSSGRSPLARSTPDLQQTRGTAPSRPSTRSTAVGTDAADFPMQLTDRKSRSRSDHSEAGTASPHARRRTGKSGGSVSDDSLNGEAARATTSRQGRQRRQKTRGTSPRHQTTRGVSVGTSAGTRQAVTVLGTQTPKPLFVDTGCDSAPSPAPAPQSHGQQRSGFGRTKMAPGLKPASERKYVPAPVIRQQQHQLGGSGSSNRRHDCLPADNPPFRARPMPDFSRTSPAPVRRQRSGSRSPAAAAAVATDPAVQSIATSGYRSGGSSSPQRQHRRRRSMDEDSLTEAISSHYGDHSVATEVLRPKRAASNKKTGDTVDSAIRNLDPTPLPQQQETQKRSSGGNGDGRSSLLLVPEKVLRDRSMTDIDLDEIFGTDPPPPPLPPPPRSAGDDSVVNERIQYWLKRNIYFHACEPAVSSSQRASSPTGSETLRSMSEHRPVQPRMEIVVQRTEMQQRKLPSHRDGAAVHVSTVEYPVRKFQQLPYGYLSPSSGSENDGVDEATSASGSAANGNVAGAEILRQAVVYARSTGADPRDSFWYSADSGSPRNLACAYNDAPPLAHLRSATAASPSTSSPASSLRGGRVRALASRFSQPPDFLSSYQQPVNHSPAAARGAATPDLVRSTHLEGGGPSPSSVPVVSSRLRRAAQTPAAARAATAAAANSGSDTKTFYFGDKSLVTRREHQEHWASDYFSRPKIEIIDRSGDDSRQTN